MKKQALCSRGSGNVYKDLGFPNAEEMQAKAILVSRILSIIEKNGWSQSEAAKVLEITQPKVSLMSRGQFSGFSIGKLINFLNRLNQDVEIVIKDRPVSSKGRGHIYIMK